MQRNVLILLIPDHVLLNLHCAQGIEKTLVREGSGPMPQKGQLVVVHCTGHLSDGTKFWSTKDAGQSPFQFHVGMGQVLLPMLMQFSLRP
jgi:FKBP-type peptidyl-prolyl cis-trans isomerase